MVSVLIDSLAHQILCVLARHRDHFTRHPDFVEIAEYLEQPPLLVHDELTELEEDGLVRCGDGERQCGYRITPEGMQIVYPPSLKPASTKPKLETHLAANQRLRNRMWMWAGGATAAMVLGEQVLV
jgi:hypothetical protein